MLNLSLLLLWTLRNQSVSSMMDTDDYRRRHYLPPGISHRKSRLFVWRLARQKKEGGREWINIILELSIALYNKLYTTTVWMHIVAQPTGRPHHYYSLWIYVCLRHQSTLHHLLYFFSIKKEREKRLEVDCFALTLSSKAHSLKEQYKTVWSANYRRVSSSFSSSTLSHCVLLYRTCVPRNSYNNCVLRFI
jgi:hypothetical protein